MSFKSFTSKKSDHSSDENQFLDFSVAMAEDPQIQPKQGRASTPEFLDFIDSEKERASGVDAEHQDEIAGFLDEVILKKEKS